MARQVRYQMVIPEWLKTALTALAENKNVSLAEYCKDVLKRHVEQIESDQDVKRIEGLDEAIKQIKLDTEEEVLREKAERDREDKRLIKQAMEALLEAQRKK